jgi:hypothetical protein
MRQFIRVGTYFLALCMLLAFPFEVQAGCKAPRRGPPGPPGPAGTGTVISNYASAFSTGTQAVTAASPYAILFNTNQVPPKGITHPVANNAQFQVLQAGVYLITWTLSLTIDSLTIEDTASISLFDVTTNTAINPNPFENQFVDDSDSKSVSGQTIVSLPANEVIELRIAFSTGPPATPFQITDPTFTITQIAPAP